MKEKALTYYVIVAVTLGIFMVPFGFILTFLNKTIGIISLVLGVLLFVSGIIAYIVTRNMRKKAEEEERRQAELEKENFKNWAEEQGFNAEKFIDWLIIDTNNKKWCKFLNYKIFEFSDIAKVKTVKHSSQTSYSSSSGSRNSHSSSHGRSNLIFSGSTRKGASNSSRSGSSQRVSYDTSTYEVHISTKLLDDPLVVIPCGYSAATANEICAAVNIMIGEAASKTKAEKKSDD